MLLIPGKTQGGGEGNEISNWINLPPYSKRQKQYQVKSCMKGENSNLTSHQLQLQGTKEEAFLIQLIFFTTIYCVQVTISNEQRSSLPYQYRIYSVQDSLLCRRHQKSCTCFWVKAVTSVALESSCL